jgi:hypothetical protein
LNFVDGDAAAASTQDILELLFGQCPRGLPVNWA